jgi:hypothetical protein
MLKISSIIIGSAENQKAASAINQAAIETSASAWHRKSIAWRNNVEISASIINEEDIEMK